MVLLGAVVAFGALLSDVWPALSSSGGAAGRSPEDDTLVIRYGDPEGRGPVHVVREGETLSSIAAERLGSAALAGDLARINQLADPDDLEVGQVLHLR